MQDLVQIETVEAYSREWKTVSGLNRHKVIFENPRKKVFDVDGAIFTLHFDENDHLKMVSFKANIPSYVHGSNLVPLEDYYCTCFTNIINDKTGINVFNFIVSRIDIVVDLELPNPVESYLKMIDKCEGYLKTGQSIHSVEFQDVHFTKKLRLFDKKIDLIGKKDIRAIKGEFDYRNMLRIEYVIEDAIGMEFSQIIQFANLETNNVFDQFKPMLIEEFNKIIFKQENRSDSNKKEELLQLLHNAVTLDTADFKIVGRKPIPPDAEELI